MVDHDHLLVRAEVRNPLTETGPTIRWMNKLINDLQMTITKCGGPHCDYVDKPGNSGIACIAMIETSHCALHIWDKQDPPLMQLDVYSCKSFDYKIVLKALEIMDPIKIEWRLFDRTESLQELKYGWSD